MSVDVRLVHFFCVLKEHMEREKTVFRNIGKENKFLLLL